MRHSARAVCDHMRSVSLVEASEKSRGALEVNVREIYQDESRHEYEIDVTNYARGIKGQDRSKKEKSTTKVKWDLQAGTRRWIWTGEHPVHLFGEDTITESTAGSVLCLKAIIDVKIPVVGRLIAKKIKGGFEENWLKYVELLDEFAQKAQ